MADAKKPEKKPAPKGPSEGQMVFNIIVLIMIAFLVIPAILRFFGAGDAPRDSGYAGILPDDIQGTVSDTFNTFLAGVSFVSIFISLLFILAISYAKLRFSEVMAAYNAVRASKEMKDLNPGVEQVKNIAPDPRWLEIERHIQSTNVSDWRVAILEADILLYDMLDQMGYPGDSIGEKLKQVDPSTFSTIQEAWKAHKIRNIIAHEGANYELSRHEAERTIELYKKVFQEFYFI